MLRHLASLGVGRVPGATLKKCAKFSLSKPRWSLARHLSSLPNLRTTTECPETKREQQSDALQWDRMADSALLITPLEGIQSSLLLVHSCLGGPWWSTIVACTLAFRLSLVPLTVVQMRTVAALLGGRVGMHLSNLNKIYSRELETPGADRAKLSRVYVSGIRTVLKTYKVQPLKIVAVPLTQIVVLLSYIVATRDLVSSGSLDLSQEGCLWFADLAAQDSTLLLPVTAVACSYAALEMSFGRTHQVPGKPLALSISDIVRELLQTMLVFGLPFIAQLPAGVFMYWIPSSVFGMSQTLVLRNNAVRNALGLPLRRVPLKRNVKPSPNTQSTSPSQSK